MTSSESMSSSQAKKASDISEDELRAAIQAGESILTVQELAKLMNKTPATIRSYFKDGHLRGIRINTMWHTINSEALRFILHGRFKGDSDGT
jgi:hypothetical protein